MPLWNMTQDKIQALTTEKQQLVTQMSTLSKKTPEHIWNSDLDELLHVINPPRREVKKRKLPGQATGSNKEAKR